MKPSNESDYDSYMLTAKYAQRVRSELADVANAFLKQHVQPWIRSCPNYEGEKEVHRFFELYKERPIQHNFGGSGFHNCFWLYQFMRFLQPTLIVESGVWKGQTTWVFRRACSHAAIHSFDINLQNLKFHDEKTMYRQHDWSEFSFDDINPQESVCFFDCHVNQARRIREAYDRGFRNLLFDDNPPAEKLYLFGLPGLPSINMLLDPETEPGQKIEWIWKGQNLEYQYKEDDEYGASELISYSAMFPDVAALTKYGTSRYLTFVRLKD